MKKLAVAAGIVLALVPAASAHAKPKLWRLYDEQLKGEIGRPHLELSLAAEAAGREEEIVARFGKPLPAKDGKVLVELAGGATEIAPVVVALDEGGIAVESLELVQPSLDDVFVAKTGYHLEAEEEETGEHEEASA